MNLVKIICGECGTGSYGPAVSADFICTDCGHMMNERDFDLDEGDTLTASPDGCLYVESVS